MITKDMTIGEVVNSSPDKAQVLQSFGMGCVFCPAAATETIAEASVAHGIDLEELLAALNN